MKNLYILILLLFVTFNGNSQQAIDGNFEFQSDPAKKYSLYIPSNYVEGQENAAMLALHPLNVNRWDAQAWRDTLIQFAETNDLILICPDGGTDGRIDDAIDTAFTTALMDSVHNWYNIDDENVFIMGFSWGGRTVYTYGLRRTDIFKGFMIIGPAITISDVSDVIDNASNKAFFLINGGNDNPNTRFTPFVDALGNLNACLDTRFLTGVGHTIDFNNRNQILTEGYNYLKTENCSLSSIRNLPTSALNIFPNPSKGSFTIEDVDFRKFEIKVSAVNGASLPFTIEGNTLRIKHAYQGMVFLEFTNDQERRIAKVMVEK